jgi:hypothetical protein
MAGKLAPKKYGDRVTHEQQQLDANGNPITPAFIVPVSQYAESPAPREAVDRPNHTRH